MPEIDKELHPYWKALIEWARENPYGVLERLEFQDGVPMRALEPREKLLFEKLARKIK